MAKDYSVSDIKVMEGLEAVSYTHLEECVKDAGAEVVFSSTECFV